MKNTFEENDAGFKYILSIKGQEAYDYHNKTILGKINSVKTQKECLPILQEWLRFFRKGHIYIRPLKSEESKSVKPSDSPLIQNQLKDWPQLSINLSAFEKYLNNKKTQDFEGIWSSSPYKIAILKTANGYKGVLIDDVPPYWQAGQVKLEIKNVGRSLKGVVYLQDHTKVESDYIQAIGQNYLQIVSFWLKRLTPVLPTEKDVHDYLTMLDSRNPYMNQLDRKTLYFRVPSFDLNQKKAIDSVLKANKEMLAKTPNLIIDIRGNGGGGDYSFSGIIPYLKTNPISTPGVEYLSTPLNNQRMLDFANKPEYKTVFNEEQKLWGKESYDTLQRHLGEFVQLSEPVEEKSDVANVKKSYPKLVGIVIDGDVGSAAEQFVLAAKQSKKVKFFGTSTYGSLDISNMYSVKSPCNDYELGYGLSRSMRIPQYILDDYGIQPDYFISNETPGYEWITYVKNILSE